MLRGLCDQDSTSESREADRSVPQHMTRARRNVLVHVLCCGVVYAMATTISRWARQYIKLGAIEGVRSASYRTLPYISLPDGQFQVCTYTGTWNSKTDTETRTSCSSYL